MVATAPQKVSPKLSDSLVYNPLLVNDRVAFGPRRLPARTEEDFNVKVGRTSFGVAMVCGMALIALVHGGCRAEDRGMYVPAQDKPPEARTLRHDGKDRSYLIQVPQPGEIERHPVILLLHPAASTGKIVWDQTSLPRIARENRAILVAPDGLNKTWDTHYWKKGGVDDVGFLTRLLDLVVKYDRGDPERIYVTGMSAGAGMTFTLAWTIGDRLAAIGPVANNLGKELLDQPIRLTKPLPVVHIMGTKDNSVPYTGGRVFGIWPVLSADETIAYWVKHNRCRTEPMIKDLPDTNAADNSRVRMMIYPGPSGVDVIHYRIEGGGHTWPNGPDDALGKSLLGETNRDIDSGTVLWDFFRDKRRLAAPNAPVLTK
jgi:polyhydroxybutyrate depolymerase